MLTMHKVKRLLDPVNRATPEDDFRILESWSENESDSPDRNVKLKYLCYRIETVDPETGKRSRLYKAMKFCRVERLPKSAKQSTSFMDMQSQVLTAVHDQGMNLVTVVANVIRPTPEGLMYLYGVQGVAEDVAEAKRIADQDYNGFVASMMGTFRVLHLRGVTAEEGAWLSEKMRSMKFMTAVRGIPKANTQGEDMGNKGIGGTNLNPDSQGTLEELITAMADYEYVIEILSTPVYHRTLTAWQNQTQKQMTEWYGQLQGTKSLSMNLSIPMTYMTSTGASQSWTKSVTDSRTVSYTKGESYNTGFSESVGQSLSQSLGRSFGLSKGTSFTMSEGQSHSISQGLTKGNTLGVTEGLTRGRTLGQTIGMTEGLTQGYSQGVSRGSSSGIAVTQSQGTSVGTSVGTSRSVSLGQSSNQSLGQSFSSSKSIGASLGRSGSTSVGSSFGQNVSASSSVGQSHSAGQGTSMGLSRNTSSGSSFGQSSNQSYGTGTNVGQSSNFTQSQSQGQNFSESRNQSRGLSTSEGASLSNTRSASVGSSVSEGLSKGTSASVSQGASLTNSMSHSEGASYGQSQTLSANKSFGESSNESRSTSVGQNDSYTSGRSFNAGGSESFGSSSSFSGGGSFGGSKSGSTSSTMGLSLGGNDSRTSGGGVGAFGASYNNSGSHSESTGLNFGGGSTASEGVTASQTFSASQGRTHSTGTSWSSGASFGESHGASYSQGLSVGRGTSYSEGYGASVGQTQGLSFSNGLSQSQGQSVSQSQGVSSSASMSRGATSSESAGTSFGQTVGRSQSASDSFGRSAGTSFSSSAGSSYGNSFGQSASQSFGSGTNVGSSFSQSNGQSAGVSSNYSDGVSSSRSASNGFSRGSSFSEGSGWSSGQTVGASAGESNSLTKGFGTSYGESAGTSYGRNQGQSYSISVSQNQSNSVSSSMSQSLSQSQSVSQSQSESDSMSRSRSQSESQSVSRSQSESVGDSESTSRGRSDGQSYSRSASNGIGQNWGQSSSLGKGRSYGESEGRSAGTSLGTGGTFTTGTSGSMGFGPSVGYSKSYQWMDQQVKDILELLEYQNERLKKALRGNGAFYTYVYIACQDMDALAAAQAAAKSTWQNTYAMTQPVQVLDLTPEEQAHLLYHFTAFSADVTRENVAGISDYKYATVLLPDEYVAYTHLPRVSEGGIDTNIDDIPKFRVPGLMRGGIYMGTQLNAERYTFKNGYRTQFDYRMSIDELMHGVFTGQSRSGKTVAAMRFIRELANSRRSATGKRLRIVIMDPKQDWRGIARFVEPERFRFYSMGNTHFRPINLNPCKIPKGVEPQHWIDGIINIYCRAYGLLERGKQMLSDTFYRLYDDARVFEERDAAKFPSEEAWHAEISRRSGQVTFHKIYKDMEQLRNSLSAPGKKVGNDTADAYARLLERLSCFSRPYSIEYRLFSAETSFEDPNASGTGLAVDELIGGDDVTVFESFGLESTFANFIFGILTSGFYKYAKGRERGYLNPSEYETVLVIEEANKVLTGNDTAGTGGGGGMASLSGQSEFEEILDQSAGYGLFIIAITQKISMMPSSIIANCGMLFMGKLSQPEDVDLGVRMIGREGRIDDRDVVKWLPKSPTGWFICRSNRGYDFRDAEPVLVQIEPLNNAQISNAELNEILIKKEVSLALGGAGKAKAQAGR